MHNSPSAEIRGTNTRTGPATVAISWGEPGYATVQPYSPAPGFPEYPFSGPHAFSASNTAYERVRDALRLLGLDAEHFGSSRWNPFGRIATPGNTVLIKPNFIRDFRDTQPGDGDCLITHGSIIRALLDYVYIALQGKGRIIIADASQDDADFEAIRRIAGLDDAQAFYRHHAGFEVEVYDLRPERSIRVNGVICGYEPLAGDPAGYVEVNVGAASAFAEIESLCHLLYGTKADTMEPRLRHSNGRHDYLLCRTALEADCIINAAKMKTHKKTGATLAMKNLVGTCGNKNWLPHYRVGTPSRGGDQFADDTWVRRAEQVAVTAFKRFFPWLGPARKMVAKHARAIGEQLFGSTKAETIRSGNWHGNDTAWRMVVDLNRIVTYADRRGELQKEPARRFFNLVDGIVGGENDGPLDPTPKPVGCVVAGPNGAAVDLVCARLMGFQHQKLPWLARAFEPHPYAIAQGQPEHVRCVQNDGRQETTLPHLEALASPFVPPRGWKGALELTPSCIEENGAPPPSALPAFGAG